MKKRYFILVCSVLLVFLFSGFAVAAISFSDNVFAPGDLRNLSLGNSTGGTVSGAGAFGEGSSVTVIATPDPGYIFVRWLDGLSVSVSSSTSYSFTMPAYDYYLYAEFAAATTPTPTPSPTPTATPTPTPTVIPEPTVAPDPTATPTPTPTPKPTPTPEATPTPEPTTTPTPEPTEAPTPTPEPAETTETTAKPSDGTTSDPSTAPTDSGNTDAKGLGVIILVSVLLFLAVGATISGFVEQYKAKKSSLKRHSQD